MRLLAELLEAVFIAVFAGVLIVVLWVGFCVVLQHVTRSRAERIALARFKFDYPEVRPGFTCKQKDDELTIVLIAYGSSRPPSRKYYAVSQDQTAREVEDDSKYRPKNDR